MMMTGRDRQLQAHSVLVQSLAGEGKGEKRREIWKRKAVKEMKGRDVREGRCKGLSRLVWEVKGRCQSRDRSKQSGGLTQQQHLSEVCHVPRLPLRKCIRRVAKSDLSSVSTLTFLINRVVLSS
jgi:hypothetical protein